MMTSSRILAVSVLLTCLSACASTSGTQTASRSSNYQCPAGETMVCEVRSTGRITHGSFSKRGTNCACQDGSREVPTIIPEIRQ